MNQDRRTIIIKEINYWKEHNLLPNRYCDFLLALYTHGQNNNVNEPPSHINGKNKHLYWLLFILSILLLALSVYILYFTQLSVLLQTGALFVFFIIMILIYNKQKKIGTKDASYQLIILLILILITSIHLTKSLYPNGWLVNGIILLNIISWFLIGLNKRYKFLSIISAISFVLMIILNVFT